MAETRYNPCLTCTRNVADNDDFCECSSRMVQYCFGCGRRLRLPVKGVCPKCGIQPALIGDQNILVPPPIQTQGAKCETCGHEVEIGIQRCGYCNAFVKKFKRFCTNPKCREEVGLTDNECKHCTHRFNDLMSDEGQWKVFGNWITCGNWKCRAHREPIEPDDFMARYRVPFLFRTERGVKIAAAKTTPNPEEFVRGYFGPDNLKMFRDGNDEDPWTPRNRKVFWILVKKFRCQECGHRDWKPSLKGPANKHITPLVKEYGPHLLSFGKKMVVDLALVIWRLLGGRR